MHTEFQSVENYLSAIKSEVATQAPSGPDYDCTVRWGADARSSA